MSKMEVKMVSLESDNTEFKNQFTQITEEAEMLNGRSNGLQVETEEKLKTTEIKSVFGFGEEQQHRKGYCQAEGRT